ncbi:ABC transporter permease [Roseivirga sp. E12]|uniref:ABC transporter permease n=1 Tax=Roseivirga sp. E12 TaxID=2819237 RepID=UPI001ABC4D54|nr:ABC transporter permease [Roseivirga sp. E12]MBO3700663.1 ABC transporter permease [Roseivirga sp. E12]
MFRSYLKSTFRKLVKDREYTIINLVGLSTGLMLFLIISIYIQRESSVDRHLADWNSTFRVNTVLTGSEGLTEEYAVSYEPLADAIKDEIANVSAATSFYSPAAQFSFRAGDENLSIANDKIYFTNENFLEVFSHDWEIELGDLSEPNTVIISDRLAQRFFGVSADAVGETLTYQDPQRSLSLIVSGVFKSSGAPSHLSYDMLIHDESAVNFWNSGLNGNWNYLYVYTYFKALPGTAKSKLDESLLDIQKKYQVDRDNIQYSVQALDDVYFDAKLNEPGINGNMTYLYVFGSFGLVVLILAAVNFINLMTARSIRRIKEVAIRKVVGASRGGLILQFLLEAIVLAFLAMIIAGVSVERLIPMINSNFDLALNFNVFQNGSLLMTILITPLVIGLASGFYPALIISRFQTKNLLKGKIPLSISGSSVRNSLLAFQFFISVLVISGVAIINSQLSYVKANGLGFNENPIIVLPRISSKSNLLIREKVANNANIKAIASLTAIPGYRNPLTRNIKPSNTSGEGIRTNGVWVSEQYSEILKLEFLAGRNFEDRDNQNTLILNRRAVESLGWSPSEALSQKLVMTGRSGFEETIYNVVGVIEDYNYGSLYEPIESLFLQNDSKNTVGGNSNIVQISKDGFNETITYLSEVWSEVEQNNAFDFYFLDDAMSQIYENEIKLSKTTQYASMISILICFLGLYGISNLTLASRKREISLRKVLGATGKSLARLLSTSYFKIIGVGVVLGLPVSYLLVNNWLENFAYHVEYSFGTYTAIAISLMVISIALVSFQTLRASNVNPLDSLRDE